MCADLISPSALIKWEETLWRDMSAPEYDIAIVRALRDIDSRPPSDERTSALISLASVTLLRDGSATEAWAHGAEQLLALDTSSNEPHVRFRARGLFLLAWLRLVSVVGLGPKTVQRTPTLPPGSGIPSGGDPETIRDPSLREQAREAARQHRDHVDRWNARQRALAHVTRLAHLVIARDAGGDEAGKRELIVAISLAAALSSDVRHVLDREFGRQSQHEGQ